MKTSLTWSWHLIAGVALAFLLGTHMSIMHLDDVLQLNGNDRPATETAQALEFSGIDSQNGMAHSPKAVGYAAVAQRSRHGFFLTTYVLLLAAALYHGLYGLRTVIFELTLPIALEKATTAFFILAGGALFVYGTYAAIAAYSAP